LSPAEFTLKIRGFVKIGKTSGGIKVRNISSVNVRGPGSDGEKYHVSRMCQSFPTLPVYGRIYSARQSQLCNKTLPKETTTALKSGMTFTHKSVWGVNKFNILF
jgi:hypothetical protein